MNNDRRIVEAYLEEHDLESTLNEVVNDIVKDRPNDPFLELSNKLLRSSTSANAVLGVRGRELFDGRAKPCLEIEVHTHKGIFRASAPGDLAACDKLNDRLVDLDVTNQEAIDAALLLDDDDDDIPANVVLACSVACCKAGAAHAGVPPFEHVAALARVSDPALPVPCVAVATRTEVFRFEEVMIVPVGAASLREAMDMAAAVYEHIPAAMEAANVVTPRVGARGAYEIHGTPIEVMTILRDAVARAQISDKISFAIDVGARDFAAAAAAEKIVPDKTKTDRDDDDDHRDEQKPDVVVVYANDQTAKDLLKLYVDLLATFPIATLEDPYWDEDVTAFLGLKEKLDLEALRAAGDLDDPPPDEIPLDLKPVGGDDNCTLQVAGDAACQTPQDLDKYDDQKTINTLTLTLSKGKTVSGCIDLAKKARDLGWGILVAADTVHPETDDTFVAHFAVGVRAGQFKAGGLLSFEQLSKYSELLRIASEDTPPPWLGVDFRASAM